LLLFRKSRAVILDIGTYARVANYVVYPVWNDESLLEDRFKMDLLGNIKLRGIPVYNVYKKDNTAPIKVL
jgi:hypothetical protein